MTRRIKGEAKRLPDNGCDVRGRIVAQNVVSLRKNYKINCAIVACVLHKAATALFKR